MGQFWIHHMRTFDKRGVNLQTLEPGRNRGDSYEHQVKSKLSGVPRLFPDEWASEFFKIDKLPLILKAVKDVDADNKKRGVIDIEPVRVTKRATGKAVKPWWEVDDKPTLSKFDKPVSKSRRARG
jgi:hypothetical protein